MSEISYPDQANAKCYQVEDNSFWFLRRNELIHWLVKRFTREGSFIDLGGGNGFVSRKLQEISHLSATMVEPGKAGCENAVERGVNQVFAGTIESFQPDKLISYIGMFDVLEHIPDDQAFLSYLHGRLETDGRIFITVPAYKFLWSHEDVAAGHRRRYTASLLKQRASEAGFKVEFSSYFFATLIPVIFLLRSIPFAMGKSASKNTERDHQIGLLASILSAVLKLESKLIQRVGPLPFGASLIVVLKKNT